MQPALTALELDPNLPSAHLTLAAIYGKQDKSAEALAETKTAVKLSGDNPNYVAHLACVYASSGDRTRAGEILERLKVMSRTQYVAPYQFAVIYSVLGNHQKALEALDRAYTERSPWLNNLYLDSRQGGRLANLRSEPKFIRLLSIVGPPAAYQP